MKSYKIFGLHCQECSNDVEESLSQLPDGNGIKIDYKKNLIQMPQEVNFDHVATILEKEKLSLFPLDGADNNSSPKQESKDHDHGHSHSHEVDLSTPGKMLIVFLLNLGFSIAEFIAGNIFRSSAILADAVHDLGDALSIGLAYIFEKISTKEADEEFSFGYTRFSLLGALITSTVLLFGSILIIIQAIPQLFNPVRPDHRGMFWMAIIAIAINGLSAWLLRAGSSANERVLSLHVLEDMLGWIAVLLVSILLNYVDWYFLDPLLSILIAGFILYNVLPEFIKAIKTFLNSTPNHISITDIKKKIEDIDQVHAMGHLHIWSIDGDNNAFTVTVFVHTDDGEEMEAVRRKIRAIIAPYHMVHYTIEVIPDMDRVLDLP